MLRKGLKSSQFLIIKVRPLKVSNPDSVGVEKISTTLEVVFLLPDKYGY